MSVLIGRSLLMLSFKMVTNSFKLLLDFLPHWRLFPKMDLFLWEDNYEYFVYETGKQLAKTMIQREGLYIFWMERYLSLATMETDDLQGESWLSELDQSPARKFIANTLQLPTHPQFSYNKQKHIQKLLLALLYQNSSHLQKKFLKTLLGS